MAQSIQSTDYFLRLLVKECASPDVALFLSRHPHISSDSLRDIGWVPGQLWPEVKNIFLDAWTLHCVDMPMQFAVFASKFFHLLRPWRLIGIESVDDLRFVKEEDFMQFVGMNQSVDRSAHSYFVQTSMLCMSAYAGIDTVYRSLLPEANRCLVCNTATSRRCEPCAQQGIRVLICSDNCNRNLWSSGHRFVCVGACAKKRVARRVEEWLAKRSSAAHSSGYNLSLFELPSSSE